MQQPSPDRTESLWKETSWILSPRCRKSPKTIFAAPNKEVYGNMHGCIFTIFSIRPILHYLICTIGTWQYTILFRHYCMFTFFPQCWIKENLWRLGENEKCFWIYSPCVFVNVFRDLSSFNWTARTSTFFIIISWILKVLSFLFVIVDQIDSSW